MADKVIFHRLVQRDMDAILRYYTVEAGESLASRFYQEFLSRVESTLRTPSAIIRCMKFSAAPRFLAFPTIFSIEKSGAASGFSFSGTTNATPLSVSTVGEHSP